MCVVRSYGTEDRQVQKPIPPRNETYEFIIFRGSDIKDLHVSEFPKTEDDDPAIVSAVRCGRGCSTTFVFVWQLCVVYCYSLPHRYDDNT